MSNLKIYPYKFGSDSSKKLSEVLNAKRIRDAGRYTPKRGHTILNWGCSKNPQWEDKARFQDIKILNNFTSVGRAVNKIDTFFALQRANVPTPEFTIHKNIAQSWLDNGEVVIERHKLTGRSGEGIRIVGENNNDPDSVVETFLQSAPLYTKFIEKKYEFRVHVFMGKVIDLVQKRRALSENRDETYNPYISSMEHGWVFSRTDILEIPSVKTTAVQAVAALGLDFGAVDIIYTNSPFVLEINSSPGLEGITLMRYADAIRQCLGSGNLFSSSNRETFNTMPTTTVRQPIAATASVNRVRPTLRQRINRQLQESNTSVVLRLTQAEARQLRSLLPGLA